MNIKMEWGNYLIIDNKTFWMRGAPILSFWNTLSKKPNIRGLSSSPLDEGYYARWEIREKKLNLLDFKSIPNFLAPRTYLFENFFGNKSNPHFAYWFSGSIFVEEGDIINCSHHFGITRMYQFEMVFKDGILINTDMKDLSRTY